MPKLKIDNREVEVPPGATVLDAARKLGIDIPTLCFRKGCEASTSCLVCMVKIVQQRRLAPACATAAADGMEIESETAEVHQVRRTALELLLSDHLGDCLAPCWFGCPARMDVPRMLRQIAAGQMREAIATIKNDIALPGVLARICPAPCEKTCRRGQLDAAVAICWLERTVADADRHSGDPYLPPCKPPSGRRVAIVGAGPTGLSAAYHLSRQGHAATIFDEHDQPGGRLRHEDPERLPPEVLDGEIDAILRLGVELRRAVHVGRDVALADLQQQFDAVLLATGLPSPAGRRPCFAGCPGGEGVSPLSSHTTATPPLFTAGTAVFGKGLAVRSVAEGKNAAAAIDQFLSGQAVSSPSRPFTTKIGRMEHAELVELSNPLSGATAGLSSSARPTRTPLLDEPAVAPCEVPVPIFSGNASQQAARCMHCDCRGLDSCKLRRYAAAYGADPRRYQGTRREFHEDAQHADVIFEPGKCIDCGLCIQIAAAAGEPLGLTYIGRGFDVRVAVPLDRSLAAALQKVAALCVAACPTAALAWKDDNRPKDG